MSQVRCQGPVRRQLRELRRRLQPHRAEEPLLRPERRHAGTAPERALLLQAVRPARGGLPQAVDGHRKPSRRAARATRGAEQDPRMVPARRRRQQRRPAPAGRLGHLAGCPLLRHRDPRCTRQVLLRVAGRTRRLPRQPEEPAHAAGQGLQLLFRQPEPGAVPLHRQGHHHLPHAVLARHAAFQRPQDARRHLRARLPDREQRREDEQEPRHWPGSAQVPEPEDEPRVAALLPGRQAQRPQRGHRLQRGRLHGARQQRPDRQVRQHRLALGRLPQQALRGQAGHAGCPGHCPAGRTAAGRRRHCAAVRNA